MELVPCNEKARQSLADSLFEVNAAGMPNLKSADYVARTFPSILLDIARLVTEQASKLAQELTDQPNVVIRHQLKPYFMFGLLLGKCPQMTSLMYNYFESSSFQPLPENSFHWSAQEQRITYAYQGFTDELIIEILTYYFKYLAFNAKWFSTTWNWSELGRFIALHTNRDIRFIAACCLSVITTPTREQHMSFVKDVIREEGYRQLVDLQIKHRQIFSNTFKPCIESKHQKAVDYVRSIGFSDTGYSFCQKSIAQLANVLLLKRDIDQKSEDQYEKAISDYVPVTSLFDSISKLAYAISVNKPCLIRGLSGSGKTAIIDYAAAKTNRINPPDYVKVHIGDQIDSKLLIGNYVCTEIPGQFEWVPGPLTRAMTYGSWIVFEDIDMAPSEMIQVIHSVIENGNLTCVSCCPIKLDSPHPDFRIFFTQRFKNASQSDMTRLGLNFVDRFCDIVDIPELTSEELIEVIETRYKLGPLARIAIELYKTSKQDLENNCQGGTFRTITQRDLFKFCSRLSGLKLQCKDGKYNSKDLDLVFLSAVDCFLASLPRVHIEALVSNLGRIVNIPSNEVQRVLLTRKLELRERGDSYVIGRVQLSSYSDATQTPTRSKAILAHTKQSLKILENVGCCIQQREPVLLVGETGVGKTSIVQHLANMMKVDLVVVNLSQQSDSSDLLGGYKPIDMREVMRSIHGNFETLFTETLSKDEQNHGLPHHVIHLYTTAKKHSQWLTYLKLVLKCCTNALAKDLGKSSYNSWRDLADKARQLSKLMEMDEEAAPMALAFSDGSLLRAAKEGKWILLDEINLAEPDVLQCLILILDSINQPHLYMQSYTEEGGRIKIHPNFRLFACMNPSTDIGKRDLDSGTRGRFTEFFVDEIEEKPDLRLVVESYVKACLSPSAIENIVNFYIEIRARSHTLSDISGKPPVYSLRSLCRALTICSLDVCQNIEKSVFESLKITFFQQLNDVSVIQVTKLIEEIFYKNKIPQNLLEAVPSAPKDGHQYVPVEGFWIQKSNQEPFEDKKYIITDSVKKNLKNLARIISLSQRKLPILIQGNTSVGKTSMINYLAKITGNRCYRINNHEHTDLQEYVGRYVLKENGELHFQEGLLVRAMKKGYWLILDELNLAPSELLEALNRVLDDNRELFIPETRELVRAHSKFVLFATQNPPEEYAGRKFLSRAFRNRFIELHFDNIPASELEHILHKRCEMAPSHANKIVNVMRELQLLRRESGCFNGGFMTMRDLFRWGERYSKFKPEIPDNQDYDWNQHLAREGLILLEGRVRTITEAETVKSTIENVFNSGPGIKVKLVRDDVYSRPTYDPKKVSQPFRHVQFTKEFGMLFTQLSNALKYKEPVLLCGQTGCGKTTACQLYASTRDQKLITYNCHLNTESSDFVGSVRPSREQAESGSTSKQTFPWVDGPLVEAMKNGAMFLVDEISLADDAVIERMNSVLEPSRSITLTEKDGEEIIAGESFRLVATMNPGDDYGKKELSPALRNRFTEIYCHNTTDMQQIMKIVKGYLPEISPEISPKLDHVMSNFLREYYLSHDIVSIRDVLSWCDFISKMTKVDQPRPFSIRKALIHGAYLVYLDQFGTCGHTLSTPTDPSSLKNKLRAQLRRLVDNEFDKDVGEPPLKLTEDLVGFKGNWFLKKGPLDADMEQFVYDTPIVRLNTEKLFRAMQLDRPILLEGDPGAGKTSLVAALARLTGNKLVRINLSEQTDISDLLGSDLPDSENTDSDKPSFCWHDGPMLRAIKESSWILLDEMNLAPQSVLEGLNACFDHRGEIYIPELNKRITVDKSASRIFACQNPYSQGAARKGLPRSFVNRFTSIYVEAHSSKDLIMIVTKLHPDLPLSHIENMVEFNDWVNCKYKDFGFEFNLRDILYWCDLITKYIQDGHKVDKSIFQPERFAQFVYLDRMRSEVHRSPISDKFKSIFARPIYEPPYRDIRLGEYSFIMARSILPRQLRLPPQLPNLCILKCQMPYIESLAKAIEFNKMPILVGEIGVGKRSIVKILAGLTGNVLNFIGANQEMDAVELLGSYEQRSLQREVVYLIDEAKRCTLSMINSISDKKQASTWSQIFNSIWKTLYVTSIRDQSLDRNEMMDAYRVQLHHMRELIANIKTLSSCETDKKCTDLLDKIDKLMRKPAYLTEPMYSTGNFEWIDSILVKSIREGTWLMIENANLMNPATLDRLNSLAELNGNLSLIEKGSTSKGIETIKPHPNFRLILAMDPQNGELSRAMRNRGVEIFMQPQFFFEDFLMLLNQNGFEPEEGKACMCYCIMQTSYDTFKIITGEDPMDEGSLLAYFGLNYLSGLTNQVRRGSDIDETLAKLLITHFTQTGFGQICEEKNIREFVKQKMDEYREKYEVNLVDDRYKWRHLRHDLISLTGGDSVVAMVERDNRIFYEDVPVDLILKPDEVVDNLDIVSTCITVKIFLESSSHGDFEHREGFIREIFQRYPSMMDIVNRHVQLLHQEYLPLISSLMPDIRITPASEMHVDTRTAPDTHHLIQCMDYEGSTKRLTLQNRWLLSLHRIMLSMIVELVEERTMSYPGNTSLWALSEQVRSNEMLKEDLVKPVAEIATDLYDLLNGILRVVINRCLNNDKLIKLLPRLFWINYLICKLRRGYKRQELIATCNQIPMLWALTYQKVIVPIIKDCEMGDLIYNNKRFSHRIQHICDFLDVPLNKANHIEKSFYHKVVNKYASTTKQCESISREVEKLFVLIMKRYTDRSEPLPFGSQSTLGAAGLAWSNSIYLDPLYTIQRNLVKIEFFEKNAEDLSQSSKIDLILDETLKILSLKKEEYRKHEDWLLPKDYVKDPLIGPYAKKCLNINRRRLVLDQFAPVWQVLLIQTKLAKLYRLLDCHDQLFLPTLCGILKYVSGIIMSPRYYLTLLKFLQHNEIRNSTDIDVVDVDVARRNRESADMYVAYLQDHLLENVVLDSQIVGWTKLRVFTSDVPTLAPLIPEYSPIVSLVASYCLDISHLKINALAKSSSQLDAMLVYMWSAYTTIKFNTDIDTQDMCLARNLMHLRSKLDSSEEFVRNLNCNESESCQCVEEYVRRQLPRYDQLMDLIRINLPTDDIEPVQKSIKLVYFGYLNFLEYAPIFTFDPSLRAREKLEVYKSELAHVKLDLHFKNTLYYWKTGENLQLLEVEPEDTANYPFATQLLIERRSKLEKSIEKLRKEYINRPKSDDSSLYYELRKSVEVHIDRYTKNVHSLMDDLTAYALCPAGKRSGKFKNLITHFRTVIKSLENSISHFRSDYALYADLMSNYLVGMCFVLQGLRCLYARLEQKFQISNLGFDQTITISQHTSNIQRVFSYNNFGLGNLESVQRKLQSLPDIDRICPSERANYIQSMMLRTVLIQMNHHITITPSDIKKCIPIVKRIADLFHCAWKKHKEAVEEQRKQKEELYRYKTSRTTLGKEITYEQREFLDICARFPTYEHIYQSHSNKESLPSTDAENMETEEKMANLIRSVDLSICIDICKAHYKFIKQASNSLLGQVDTSERKELPQIDIEKWTELEAETLYAITRHCLPTLDKSFDSLSIECHLLQADRLRKMMQKSETPDYRAGDLKNSIEILDDDIFDIYHSPNAHEVLKLQDFIDRLDTRINHLRSNGYENNPTLLSTVKLITNISSFLITDPLMKFVTGAHAILEKIEEWNRGSSHREDRMIKEMEELIALIDDWRAIELKSWMNSLHLVKRKYIDGTLCDMWFHLHEAFGDPYSWAMKKIISLLNEDDNFELKPEHEILIYEAFAMFVKDFLEEATLGDYQIRLDLVFSFAIQTRFAGIYDKTKKEKPGKKQRSSFKIDNEKLTTYVYNIYTQYKGLLSPVDAYVAEQEREHHQNLSKETRLVSWRNRNLWEIKQTFRTSHRKLNNIMNSYSKMLHEPLPKIRPQPDKSDFTDDAENCELDSDRISATLAATQQLVSSVKVPNDVINADMIPVKKASGNVNKMKEFHGAIYDQMSAKYLKNLMDFEDSIRVNAGHIKNFKSHKPSELIIDRRDSKEEQEEKYKLCRQMHNSKKFALQSIFKDMETLGASYRRGLRRFDKLDRSILSSEPLRGMIQDQSHIVLKAIDKLVDQQIIHSCNDKYRDLIASSIYLLCNSQEPAAELDRGQVERIRGFAMDMTQDIIEHKRIVAFIYKHLIDIQAATSRLTALEDRYKGRKVVIYKFSKVHTIVRQFDELVGRVYLAIAKIERIAKCCKIAHDIAISGGSDEVPQDKILLDTILKEKGSNSELMTQSQIEHLHETIPRTRQSIADISDNLRDMLKYNPRNHLYSDDDLDRLGYLFKQFTLSIRGLLPDPDSKTPNTLPDTVLGSLRMLEGEAIEKLKPLLDDVRMIEQPVEVHQQANLDKLNMRLHNMMRQVKLAAQGVYKRELESSPKKTMSESEKRNLKPFNYLDSSQIGKLLRLDRVAKHTGNCLATLNNYDACTNIAPIVTNIRPILFVYSQDVSRYINIILGSLNIRLKAATQLTRFFTDVLVDGFGLPYKTNELEEGTNQKSSKLSEDNAGFGEGQGEVDVSKKLEFESQLDELKKDSDEAEKDQDVEAHDDGVEMSDDIDAKAQGPDDQNGTEEKDGDDEDDDEEEEDHKDLDKDMGHVDQDEEKLDENLWGEKDDLPGEEDDEEDIRETDVDPGMMPDKDSTDLKAKDEKLSESKPKTDKKDDENETAEKTEEVPATEDVTMNEQPETTDNDNELDLGQEADEALRPDPTEKPQDDDDTNTGAQDEIDMSVSDGEDLTEEQRNAEQMDDAKSEGEISKGEGSDDDEVKNSQSVLDDDSIDKQLEVALDPAKKDDLNQENFLEDVIHNMPNMGAGQDKDGQLKFEIKKIGNYTLYSVPYEGDDDLDDFDEADEHQAGEQIEDKNMEARDEAATRGRGSDGQAEDKVPMDIDCEKDSPGAAEEKLETSRPTKRTLAEDQNHGSEAKRKKILEASGDAKEQQGDAKDKDTPDDTNKDSTKKRANTFRHIEADKQSAIEVIDICSSSDEELVDTNAQQSDQNNDTKLKPKETIEKSNATSADQTAKDEDEKSEPMVVQVDTQPEKEDATQESNDIVKNDDILKETSSISSINSGELKQVDSDYMDCLEDAGSSNRQLDTIYNTNIGLLKYISLKGDSGGDGTNKSATNLMELIDRELGKKVSEDYDSVDTDRLTGLWLDCTRSTSHLVHELCQQLQIVLEPTKMSKYKGDYKSGKRLNMRKVISYIASHYRKDKIWLRRTKPNKRTYNIMLAVDNSSSMSENNCRQMTYQSLALLAGSLSRIEAGSLSVVSFGEKFKCIHEFGQPYMDAIGAQWLRELRFDESKTSYGQLLKNACASFVKQALVSQSQQSVYQRHTVSQLLVIISDGRNISNEEEEVKNHLRQLKSMGVLTLFVIIDDLKRNSGNSIIDIKRCIGIIGTSEFRMPKYMELFPFPFYVLLRQMETMPSVLGDALRQWFQLVSTV